MIRSISAMSVLFMLACAALAGGDPSDSLKQEVQKFSTATTFEKTLSELSKLSGLAIEPDWAVIEATGAGKANTVSFAVPSATIEQLLDMTLMRAAADSYPLAWYLDGKVVRISTQYRVIHRGKAYASTAQPDKGGPRLAGTDREVKFDNTPLKDALAFFTQRTKLNFNVNWKSLEESGIAQDTPVTLQAHDLSVGRAMDLVLDQVSGSKDKLSRAYWIVSDGVITIASGAALNQETKTRVYDVSALLVVTPNFHAPRIDITATPTGGNNAATNGLFQNNSDNSNTEDANDTNMGEKRQKARENLIASLKSTIGDDMWSPDGKGSITFLNGKLVVTQTPLGFKLMENAGRK
jgi:hypothetical protein